MQQQPAVSRADGARSRHSNVNRPQQQHRHAHHPHHAGLTCRDYCYPVMLLVLVLMLAAGLSTLFVMDKKQAYVGGTFLFIFLILVLCSMGGWCYPNYYYYAPFGDYWSFGPAGYPYGFGPTFGYGLGPEVIIEDNNFEYNTGDGGGDGGGGDA